MQQSVRENVEVGKLAKGLGWFSIGLGAAEIAAPERLSRLIGVRNRPVLLRLLGLREITSGIGILTRPRPAGWLWSRVGGDIMDLALLGTAMKSNGSRRPRKGRHRGRDGDRRPAVALGGEGARWRDSRMGR